MNKITQAVLATVVLSFGLGSTAVYANQTAGKPGSQTPHKPGKHGCGDKCDGKLTLSWKFQDIVIWMWKHHN